MKIGKQYIGRMVEFQWMDPNFGKGELHTLLRGRAALATWVERGVIVDITDGVVLIAHSEASSAGKQPPPSGTDELARTAVPEVLIEKLTLFAVEKVVQE